VQQLCRKNSLSADGHRAALSWEHFQVKIMRALRCLSLLP